MDSYEQAIQDGIEHVEMLESTLRMIREEAEPGYTDPVGRCAQIVAMVDSALGDDDGP